MMMYSIFGVDKGYVCEAYECTYKLPNGQHGVLYNICVPDDIKGVQFEKVKSFAMDIILHLIIIAFAILFTITGFLL